MADRTTKFLLVIIALALWGLLLKPTVTPIIAQAQDGGSNLGGMVVTDRDVYVRTGSSIYRFERNLQPKDLARFESVNGEAKYVHHAP